jgi:7-cyano-7-deazaguanine reductase
MLKAIARAQNRTQLGIGDKLPFSGCDIWNSYELTWLNETGKPVAAMAEFHLPATSPNIIESKSLKLYLHSFSTKKFKSQEKLSAILSQELSKVSGAKTNVKVHEITSIKLEPPVNLPGFCIDNTNAKLSIYNYDPDQLSGGIDHTRQAQETLYSHLFQSNCPMTGQPDWASILISYRGSKIKHDHLLAYLVSFREHAEFHEQCVERIFMDIKRYCQPEVLTIYARYTRRGGLDINPFRSDFENPPANLRLLRQ